MNTGPEGIPGIWGGGFQRRGGLGPAGTALRKGPPWGQRGLRRPAPGVTGAEDFPEGGRSDLPEHGLGSPIQKGERNQGEEIGDEAGEAAPILPTETSGLRRRQPTFLLWVGRA